MSSTSNSGLFELTNITGSILDPVTNSTTFITGDPINGDQELLVAENMQHIGFASRPSLAVPGQKGPVVLTVKRRTGDLVIASRDQTSQDIYGNLEPGETCLYAGGTNGTGQAKVMLKADGSITLATTANTNAGAPLANQAGGSGVYFRVDPDRFQFIAPWGSMTFDRSGFHIKTSAGLGFDLMNMPASLAAFGGNGRAQITASSITMNAPSVFLGPSVTSGGTAYMPAAYGVVPGPAGTPILGVGVGAVTVAASSSTKVFVGV